MYSQTRAADLELMLGIAKIESVDSFENFGFPNELLRGIYGKTHLKLKKNP